MLQNNRYQGSNVPCLSALCMPSDLKRHQYSCLLWFQLWAYLDLYRLEDLSKGQSSPNNHLPYGGQCFWLKCVDFKPSLWFWTVNAFMKLFMKQAIYEANYVFVNHNKYKNGNVKIKWWNKYFSWSLCRYATADTSQSISQIHGWSQRNGCLMRNSITYLVYIRNMVSHATSQSVYLCLSVRSSSIPVLVALICFSNFSRLTLPLMVALSLRSRWDLF